MTTPYRRTVVPGLLALLCLSLASCGAIDQGPVANGGADAVYQTGAASRDGIGKFYVGREISHVMGHRGAAWLERPDREREERTDLLIKNLPLQHFMVFHRPMQGDDVTNR